MVVYEEVSKFFPTRAQSGRNQRPELMVALDRVSATIKYPDGSVQGKTDRVRLVFDVSYMQMAAQGKL